MPTKVRLVKAVVFLVVVCGCESWMLKKAEGQGIDAFELWCWRKLLRVPWTARKSNRSILKEINAVYALKGLMLKLQFFGYLMQTVDSLEKALMLERLRAGERGVTEDDMVGWHHRLDGHELEQTPRYKEHLGMLQSMGSQRVRHDLMTEKQQQQLFMHILGFLPGVH